jgi:competence protein ComEC
MVTVPWAIGRDLFQRTRAGGDPPARRSLFCCALIGVGYWLAAFVAAPVHSIWFFGAAPALLIVAILARGWACRIALSAAVVALAAGWYAARIHERPRASLAWAVEDEASGADPVLAAVRGVVADVPRELAPAGGSLGRFVRTDAAVGFTLALSSVEASDGDSTPASGTLRVRVEGSPKEMPDTLRPGAPIRLCGRLRPVRPASNPGEPDWPALAAQEGRIGELNVPNPSLITGRERDGFRETALAWWHGSIGAMHARCLAAIDGPAPTTDRPTDQKQAEARALLGALLLGERDSSLGEVNAAFTRLGLVHLVAISGFNLAIMASFAMVLLRFSGDRGWLEPTLLALLVVLYMLVLPAQAPILRAGVLVLAILIADAAGRRYDRAALVGWIACVLLIVRPLDAWSLGFQLSFGIVVALLTLGDTMHHRLWGVPLRGLTPEWQAHGRAAWSGWWWRWLPRLWGWLVRAMKAQIGAGVLAWAVSIPIIACHTGQIGLLTPLLTLIVLPPTIIVLWGGYLALLGGVIVPGAAGLCAGILNPLARLLVNVIMALDRVPGASVQLPRISPWWAVACVAGAAYLVLHGSRRDRWSWAIVLTLAAWLGGEMVLGTRLPPGVALRIDSLAVGDGSCHLLRRGDQAALWDCGSLTVGVGGRLIPQALRALGVRSVPTVVVTHAHIDHFAALPDIVEDLHVRRVYLPAQFQRFAADHPGSAPAELLAGLARRGVRVWPLGKGDTVELAGQSARILWPPADRDFRDANDSSIVAMLPVRCEAGERRALLTGDAAREALANLLPAPGSPAASLRADVLELPHHGAFIEPAVELVRVVDPSIVVQSTGPKRAADRRWAGPLAGRTWYATPRRGASWVEIRADGTMRSGSCR